MHSFRCKIAPSLFVSRRVCVCARINFEARFLFPVLQMERPLFLLPECDFLDSRWYCNILGFGTDNDDTAAEDSYGFWFVHLIVCYVELVEHHPLKLGRPFRTLIYEAPLPSM